MELKIWEIKQSLLIYGAVLPATLITMQLYMKIPGGSRKHKRRKESSRYDAGIGLYWVLQQ